MLVEPDFRNNWEVAMDLTGTLIHTDVDEIKSRVSYRCEVPAHRRVEGQQRSQSYEGDPTQSVVFAVAPLVVAFMRRVPPV